MREKLRTLAILCGTALVSVACAGPCTLEHLVPDRYCTAFLTRTRGRVGVPFQGRIGFKSNYVGEAEYSIGGELPPGITFDPSTGSLSGVPTQAGNWFIWLKVRDRERGHVRKGTGEKLWSSTQVEVEIVR